MSLDREIADKRRHFMEEPMLTSSNSTSNITSSLPPHVKPLGQIVKLDMLRQERPDTVEQLWVSYHATKQAVCAVIPRDVYITFHQRATLYPTFLLPVFRSEGAEMFLLQHEGHQTHFTSLGSYQAHGSESPEFLTLTYYIDLIDSHDCVLVHGEVDLDRLSLIAAKSLTEGMREFYITNEQGWSLVQALQNSPTTFSFESIVTLAKSFVNASISKSVELSSALLSNINNISK